jgi:hypothetical protein
MGGATVQNHILVLHSVEDPDPVEVCLFCKIWILIRIGSVNFDPDSDPDPSLLKMIDFMRHSAGQNSIALDKLVKLWTCAV